MPLSLRVIWPPENHCLLKVDSRWTVHSDSGIATKTFKTKKKAKRYLRLLKTNQAATQKER
jgi:hypothetical protein